MKKILLTSVALIATAGSAFAADLPSKKAAPMLASVSPWQGVYAGINAGYGLNNITSYSSSSGVLSGTGSVGQQVSVVEYVGGAVAGAQVGYNHVFANHWMAGAELDFDWANIYNNTNPSQSYNNSWLGNTYIQANQNYNQNTLNWIGTVRARIGYDMGRFLPYITGGFAYGGLTGVVNNTAVTGTVSDRNVYINKGNSSTVGTGWAAGAGAEYLVTDNWSVKGEYLYTSIGGITTDVQTIGSTQNNGQYLATAGIAKTGAFGVHQVRAGLNYHTNWWGAAPVVAKY